MRSKNNRNSKRIIYKGGTRLSNFRNKVRNKVRKIIHRKKSTPLNLNDKAWNNNEPKFNKYYKPPTPIENGWSGSDFDGVRQNNVVKKRFGNRIGGFGSKI